MNKDKREESITTKHKKNDLTNHTMDDRKKSKPTIITPIQSKL